MSDVSEPGEPMGDEAADGRGANGIPPASSTDAEREVLAAMQVPTQQIIMIGLVLWLVALAATLVVPALHEGDRSWWPWACVAGFVLGTIGLLYVRRGRGNAHDAG